MKVHVIFKDDTVEDFEVETPNGPQRAIEIVKGVLGEKSGQVKTYECQEDFI